jgi:glycosyltransferase involved in cell wall biosynthesis
MQGAQTSFSRNRGVGRYTIELAKAMAKDPRDHEIILALNGAFPETIEVIRAEFDGVLSQKNIRVWQQFFDTTTNDPRNSSRKVVGEILREDFLNSLDADIIFSTNLQEGLFDAACTSVKILPTDSIICSTLHDVIPLIYPDRYLKDSTVREWYREKIEFVKRSDIILTDSHSSKEEIGRLLDIPPEKIYIIHPAVDHIKFRRLNIEIKDKRELLDRIGISRPFVMYTGGHNPHKNLDVLYSAFSKISKNTLSKYQLVMVGEDLRRDEINCCNRLRKLGISKDVVFPGHLSDDELIILYNLCELFVFPSVQEGFGLPPLEAMASGAAVIASNASSLPEVVGYEDALFDPYNELDLARKMERALTESKFRASLIENETRQAAKFSWENSGESLLMLFEEIAQKNCMVPAQSTRTNRIQNIIHNIASTSSRLHLDDTDLIAISYSIAETFCIKKGNKCRLFVDVSAIIRKDDQTGIQRVTRAICNELLNSPNQFDIELIYTTPEDDEFYKANVLTNKISGIDRNSINDEMVAFCPGDILLFLDFHPGVTISHREKIQFLRNKGVCVYHLVHDILPVTKSEFFWPDLCSEFYNWLLSISNSDGAICISRAVANELRVWLMANGEKRLRPFKVGVFHLGADVENSIPTHGIHNNAIRVFAELAARPTFLMVGTVEPRKGQKQTLACFEKLWSQGVDANLVIVGKQGWKVEDLVKTLRSHPERNNRLFWLEGISDEYLEKVYTASTCLIAASEGEGFGLPLIEAAQHKLPIIARDIPVFREVAGDFAFYFIGMEPDDLAKAVREWLDLYQSGQHPMSDEMPWLTWKESTDQLLDVILNNHWYTEWKGTGVK